MSDPPSMLAGALLVLLALPLVGAVTAVILRRRDPATVRQALLANALITAVVATAMVSALIALDRSATNSAEGVLIRLPVWTLFRADDMDENLAVGPWWTISLSIGCDSINRGPLLVIPWSAWAALLLTTGRPPETWGRYAGLLLLEALMLFSYAAEDALAFSMGAVLSGLLMAQLTAVWGTEDRRLAAESVCLHHLLADALTLLAGCGLGASAIWGWQQVHPTLPAWSLSWSNLAQTLPQLVAHHESAAEYWSTHAGGWWLLLMLATAISSGVPPFHRGSLRWGVDAATPVVVLGISGMFPWGFYLWQRLVAPVFAADLPAWSDVLGAWGALATLGAGMLCLAQTDLRRFALWFGLSLQGMAWLTLSGAAPEAAAIAVETSTFAGLATAALLALSAALERRFGTRDADTFGGLHCRLPRWTAAFAVVLALSIGFPALGRWRDDWYTAWVLAPVRPGQFAVGLCGWLIVTWAAVWLGQRLTLGPVHEPLSENQVGGWPLDSASNAYPPPSRVFVEDLTVAEGLAVMALLATAVAIGLGVGTPRSDEDELTAARFPDVRSQSTAADAGPSRPRFPILGRKAAP